MAAVHIEDCPAIARASHRANAGTSRRQSAKRLRSKHANTLATAFDEGAEPFGVALAQLCQAWQEDVRQATAILKQLAKARRADVATATLSRMPEHEVAVNEFHYGACLGACAKAGSWQLALSLVEQMDAEQMKVGVVAWTSALTACARSSAWRMALCFFERAVRACTVDAALYSAGISACEKGGQWQKALDLLAEMPESGVTPNIISYNAAISACAGCARWQRASALFDAACAAGPTPTVVSYSAILSACQQPAKWQCAVGTFWRCKSESEPDIIAGNSLVAALEGGARWSEALQVLGSLASAGLLLDRFGANAALSAAAKASTWQKSLCLFRFMNQRPIHRKMIPDHVTHSALIKALEGGGLWHLAWALLGSMRSSGLRPNVLDQTSCIEAGTWWTAALGALLGQRRADSLLAAAAIGCMPSETQKEELLLAMLQRWEAEGTSEPLETAPWEGPAAAPDVEMLRTCPGVVVVNKPAGIRTEAVASAARCEAAGLFPRGFHLASRLDSPTSGVLPITCGPPGSLEAEWLQLQFAARRVKKEYWCLCQGVSLGCRGVTGEVRHPLLTREVEECVFRTEVSALGRPAHTAYEVLGRYESPDVTEEEEITLLKVQLLTGRTHQIRVHLASIGRPLIGDVLYGIEVPWCSRLFLHCRSLRFRDLSRAIVDVEAPLPQELSEALASLSEIDDGSEEEKSYSCKIVSWDDVSRGTVGGSLSCWGANITDTYLKSRSGTALFTVRSNNWNEKLGYIGAQDPYGKYAGLPGDTDLSDAVLDAKCSIRFQTTFLPVDSGSSRGALEFASEAYNYNTTQDGRGKKRLYHHATDGQGKIHRYWLEAEESRHSVGGPQEETAEERADALRRGKATSSVIGIKAMGKRFNVLMTIQVPLKQRASSASRFLAAKYMMDLGSKSTVTYGPGGEMIVTTTSCYAQEDTSAFGKGCLRSMGWDDRGRCRDRDRSRSRGRTGRSSAARVSRGSEVDVWPGLSVKAPQRHDSEHVTITVVVYNVVKGGVPSTEDVINAIDDLEKLYSACSGNARLADSSFDFMKQELKVKDMLDISAKVQFQPPTSEVEGFDAFPVV
ncbi:unnamed protein product [Symbiodinium sp. CCMP2592]|nr:unnamed protein product [Symbiodinium sp. CCMP2592]